VQRTVKLHRTFCHVSTVHRLRWNCIQGESAGAAMCSTVVHKRKVKRMLSFYVQRGVVA